MKSTANVDQIDRFISAPIMKKGDENEIITLCVIVGKIAFTNKDMNERLKEKVMGHIKQPPGFNHKFNTRT